MYNASAPPAISETATGRYIVQQFGIKVARVVGTSSLLWRIGGMVTGCCDAAEANVCVPFRRTLCPGKPDR